MFASSKIDERIYVLAQMVIVPDVSGRHKIRVT